MTAMTSDERREVARKIREYVDAYGDKIEDAEMVLLGTVWCRGEFNEVVKPTSEAELLAMVADLIDPTCHMVDTDHEYEDSIRCDVCQMTFNRPWEPFKFCPNCGARVVTRDADGAR